MLKHALLHLVIPDHLSITSASNLNSCYPLFNHFVAILHYENAHYINALLAPNYVCLSQRSIPPI